MSSGTVPSKEQLANGATDGSQQTFINRVAAIPVVSETIETIDKTLAGNSYTAGVYGKASNLATSAYQTVEPTIQKFGPQLATVDTYANKGLDAVQARVPGLFEVKTEDVYNTARKPADQAYAVGKTYHDAAHARLSPIAEQFQTQLQNVQATIQELQNRLSSRLKGGQDQASKATDDATKSAEDAAGRAQSSVQGITDSLLKELDGLKSYLQTQRKELPQQAQTSLQPIIDRFSTGYTKIREEISKPNVPVTQKGQNILAYTQETVQPIIGETIDAVRAFLGRQKSDAEAVAGEAQDQASKAVDDAKNSDLGKQAQKTFDDAKNSDAGKKAQEVADKAGKKAGEVADQAGQSAEQAQKKVNGSS